MRFPIFVMALMLSFGAYAETTKAESMQPMRKMMVGDDCPTKHKKDDCPTKHKDKEKCRHEGMHASPAACLYEGKPYSEGAVLKMQDGDYRCTIQSDEGKTPSRLIWTPVKGSPNPAK